MSQDDEVGHSDPPVAVVLQDDGVCLSLQSPVNRSRRIAASFHLTNVIAP